MAKVESRRVFSEQSYGLNESLNVKQGIFVV